jgi:predicted small secreted protein
MNASSRTALIAAASALLLAACNTWQGVKEDAHIVGNKAEQGARTVGHAVGTGIEKAGEGIEKAGDKVKEVAK